MGHIVEEFTYMRLFCDLWRYRAAKKQGFGESMQMSRFTENRPNSSSISKHIQEDFCWWQYTWMNCLKCSGLYLHCSLFFSNTTTLSRNWSVMVSLITCSTPKCSQATRISFSKWWIYCCSFASCLSFTWQIDEIETSVPLTFGYIRVEWIPNNRSINPFRNCAQKIAGIHSMIEIIVSRLSIHSSIE